MSKLFKLSIILSLALYAIPYTLYPIPTLAQYQGVEVNSVFKLSDAQAVNGDILSLNDSGIVRSTLTADNRLLGVLQTEPLAVNQDIDKLGTPITRNGTATVRVSNLSGEIKAGDYITSSEIPGVGQKALRSGYVIGMALNTFSTGQPQTFQNKQVQVGTIPVAVRIEYAEISSARGINRLFNYLTSAIFRDIQSPEQVNQALKYILATIIALTSFLIGFLTFTRSIPKSIESIGRNPMAKNAIYMSVIINITFTLVTTVIGIVAALLILRM